MFCVFKLYLDLLKLYFLSDQIPYVLKKWFIFLSTASIKRGINGDLRIAFLSEGILLTFFFFLMPAMKQYG